MNLHKIHIKNYRGFEDVEFELNSHFNVFIGDNGAGKTSFLDACAMALSPFLSSFGGVDINLKNNIRIKMIDGQPRPQLPFSLNLEGKLLDKPISWYLKKTRHEIIYQSSGRLERDGSNMLKYSRAGERINFPLLAYHGTGRLWTQHEPPKYTVQEEGIFAGYRNGLSAKSDSKAFISWYKTYEDEIRKFDRPEDKVFLKVLNETITSFVEQWEEIAYSFRRDELIGFYVNGDGERKELSFNQLSDGYRNVIGMVADIAYRCIQLNPHLKENVIKETEGIVLIDEIDLHLHPNWQRRIVSDLKNAFPKVQFIATTHSPFIIQSLKSEELINLDTPDTPPEAEPYKLSIEDIAESVMHVEGVPRSVHFNEMVGVAAEYYNLIKNGETENAEQIAALRERLTELEARYSEDAAFVALLKAERETRGL